MFDLILSITVLSALALLAGAFWLWRKTGTSKQAVLMAVLAVVMLVNVLIWTLPPPASEMAGADAEAPAGTGAR